MTSKKTMTGTLSAVTTVATSPMTRVRRPRLRKRQMKSMMTSLEKMQGVSAKRRPKTKLKG